MRKRRRLGIRITVLLFTLILISALTACSDTSETDGLKGEYTVVSDTSFVPFEFKEDGEYVGFDIDLIYAIAEEAGFEINFETTNFDGIIPGLQTGQFDIAIAGIGITEERTKTIDYSDPYYESGLQIAVSIDNDTINSLEDLEGKTIATRLGSTSAAFIEENIDDAEMNQYEQLDQAYLAVENGSVDAILYDAPNVAYYIQTEGEDTLKMVGDLYQAENYGIAITKGKDELVEAINEALKTLKENGTYDEIYEKWFGEKPK
ncbi:MAG TPA: glutamine ABC transporter substrate-binding protein [Bacillota bacterium]|nr:glutamine ABC transporter substrate-binding protein [Bacillota bacterium]